jgi:gluconate 2-dehydrogenase gamma chain
LRQLNVVVIAKRKRREKTVNSADFTRREFMKIAGASAGSAILVSACAQNLGRWRFFTEAEAVVVEAISEQIIPADEDAGAKEANVINFIDKQLAGVFAKHQEIYRLGITGVQQTSRLMFGSSFETLAWEQQTEVLKAMEAGEAQGEIWQTESAQRFFGLIRDHTMQGFYGSPRHGGNRRFVSFKMLDLDHPRIVGQNRYNVFPGK